jgi:2-polyprenyl-3-methyl-5-hydroxy-6-metoxy-1,4-benzoquinol methylase/tetratricopeptide (TPR) repeat protein
MNRKERRATSKVGGHASPPRAALTAQQDANIAALFTAAVEHDRTGKLAEAERLCRSILARDVKHVPSLVFLARAAQQSGRHRAAIKMLLQALDIDDSAASAHDAIALAYAALGRRDDAIRHFTQAIACGLRDVEQLVKQIPAIGVCLARLRSAWPRRLTLAEIADVDGLSAIADDALLASLLRSRPVRDVELERFLTALRYAAMQVASADTMSSLSIAGAALDLCCALAQQCFINEYAFDVDDAELNAAKLLHERVEAQMNDGVEVTPLQIAVVGSYFPLYTLSASLTARRWPEALENLITQQVREPQREAQYRDVIPSFGNIEDTVSMEVQRQYEENPYPRWTLAGVAKPTTIEEFLRKEIPFARVSGLPDADDFDILIAGCGTGQHSIRRGLEFPRAKIIGVDLSRASLAYAERKSHEAGLGNIEYRQADILVLESIGRSFDLIEAVGVLHHLSDPAAGWRALLSLLRPNGLMAIGLYSAKARRILAPLRRARLPSQCCRYSQVSPVSDRARSSAAYGRLFQPQRLSRPSLQRHGT